MPRTPEEPSTQGRPIDLHELRQSGRATVSVPEAAVLLGISLGSARKAVKNKELPVLRLGCRVLVPVPRLLQMLGAEGGRNE